MSSRQSSRGPVGSSVRLRPLPTFPKQGAARGARSSMAVLTRAVMVCLLGVIPQAAAASAYYVSASGNDVNSGTQAAPWCTLARASAAVLRPGDVLLLRGGDTFAARSISAPKRRAPRPTRCRSRRTAAAGRRLRRHRETLCSCTMPPGSGSPTCASPVPATMRAASCFSTTWLEASCWRRSRSTMSRSADSAATASRSDRGTAPADTATSA